MSLRKQTLPGLGLSAGTTILYLGLIVLIPISTLFVKTAAIGWPSFWHIVTTPRALASYRLTFGASLLAALVNGLFGFLVAWVLIRYPFRGKRIVDAMIDLPFALPTAVAGITLATLYAPHGWIGSGLARLGIQGSFSPLGVVIALTFVGLPFVVRTVEPVLQQISPDIEEAAAILGATPSQSFFRVLLPILLPASLTGMTLAFARAIGEYGSVIFIAGNMPLKTEITPLLIVTKLEQFDYAGANALAVVMLVISFALLLMINTLQRWKVVRSSASPPTHSSPTL
jgi:sulfate transport system permease protein